MASKAFQDKRRRADLLMKVPPSATRVRVMTARGEQKYKNIVDLADTDEIQTNKNGDPIVMKGKPGRKAFIEIQPANDTVAQILKLKQKSMDEDEILVRMKSDSESAELLHAVIVGLGEEQASLKFERDQASLEGRDTASLSSKRVLALRAVADTWLKRMDQITTKSIDLDSPGFNVLFRFIMDTLRDAMTSAKLQPEQIEVVFARFSSMVTDEWKAEAKTRMKRPL